MEGEQRKLEENITLQEEEGEGGKEENVEAIVFVVQWVRSNRRESLSV